MNELTKEILKECFYNQKKLTRSLLLMKFPENCNEINGVINNYFLNKHNNLYLNRDYLLVSLDLLAHGLGFIYKRKFYHVYNYLPNDIILYNLKSKRVISLVSRKYKHLTVYLKNNQVTSLNKELSDYDFYIPKKLMAKHLYQVGITSVSNNIINLELLNDLGEFSNEDLYIKDLLARQNLYNIYDKDYVLNKICDCDYLKNNDTTFITIDQDGAKDLDDAIGFREDSQNYYLYISIADVSSFIIPNSDLFNEAKKRLFSVYFLDKVVPMLPNSLSSNLCSLLKGNEKYVISNIFTISKNNFKIIKHEIKKEKITISENYYFSQMMASELVKKIKLISEKISSNYLSFLNFNNPELRFFYLNGELNYSLNKESEGSKLIETLMILTNNYMAKFYKGKGIPAIYRICPTPISEKISYFNKVMKLNNYEELNYNDLYNSYKEVIKHNFNNLFYQDQLIKTQEKAIYLAKPALHYPLNLKDYLHFTAPIRRFTDLINHLQLNNFLTKKKLFTELELGEITELINQKEKDINKFTSLLNKLFGIIYYQKNNQVLNGYITGFFGSKIDVLLENNLYVSIPFSSLDDYYIISEDRLMCYNLKNTKNYKIGDKIKVKPLLLDLDNLIIDFKIVSGNN